MTFIPCSYEALKTTFAKWLLENSRLEKSTHTSKESREEFVFSFVVPEDEYKLYSCGTNDKGSVEMVFKAEYKLSDWQSVSGECLTFEYFKLFSANVDDDGNMSNIEKLNYMWAYDV